MDETGIRWRALLPRDPGVRGPILTSMNHMHFPPEVWGVMTGIGLLHRHCMQPIGTVR